MKTPSRFRSFASLMCVAVVLALLMGACRGGGGKSSKDNEGSAAAAAASYFNEERVGGVLPEASDARQGTIASDSIKLLSVDGTQKSVTARYCIPYSYLGGADTSQKTRVYIASLTNGEWLIEPQAGKDSCDGVS